MQQPAFGLGEIAAMNANHAGNGADEGFVAIGRYRGAHDRQRRAIVAPRLHQRHGALRHDPGVASGMLQGPPCQPEAKLHVVGAKRRPTHGVAMFKRP